MALSAMMRQYLELKEEHKQELLFFRVGDFYEMFFDDAITASRELELTLTGKDCGLEERAPMCGVPYHAVDTYVGRLVEKGFKVAICEQLIDPALATGLVDRGITRIITPGTVIEENMLKEKEANYLLSVYENGNKAGLAFCDISTGAFYAYEVASFTEKMTDELSRIMPKEVISVENDALADVCSRLQAAFTTRSEAAFAYPKAKKLLKAQFGSQETDDELTKNAQQAAGALLDYLIDTQKNALVHINHLQKFEEKRYMALDHAAMINLELTKSIRDKSRKGSLLSVIDKTVTSMGGRELKSWVEEPLLNKDEIVTRQDAIEYLVHENALLTRLRDSYSSVHDIERLLSRIAYGTVNPRDCIALANTLASVPEIKSLLRDVPGLLGDAARKMDPLTDLCDLLTNAISEDAPILIKEGGIFKNGFNEQLDQYRNASLNGKSWLVELEQKERDATGIKGLKIGYNRLFGYYIEVTKSFYDLVPLRYTRKQTLANAERFITDELKKLEDTILGAEDGAVKLEYEMFLKIRELLLENIEIIRDTANALKTIDAIEALAKAALDNNYVRPSLNEEGRYEILNGRHPVVETSLGSDRFVPNDTHLNEESRVMIITGPNMAGKSTYMRQVALIVLLAQIGSFVPADEADISLTDRIFTRIGANDDLYGGRSTFMVEMDEMSVILKNATEKSLVILDEVGRGTSTFDGLSIAWAAVEHLAGEKCKARTLFATHYHELSVLEGQLSGVVNYRVTATERGEDVIFLRKVVPGGEDKSYGIAVAKLAGLPKSVVARARQIMARLEVDDEQKGSLGKTILDKRKNAGDRQVSLEDYRPMELIEEIRKVDVMSLSPIDALNYLYTLSEKARRI